MTQNPNFEFLLSALPLYPSLPLIPQDISLEVFVELLPLYDYQEYIWDVLQAGAVNEVNTEMC